MTMTAGGTLRMVTLGAEGAQRPERSERSERHQTDAERARELELESLRTRVANQAASLAETVTDGFEGFHLGAGDWIVELMSPAGPSTGGGALARQHIRLVPRRRGYSAIIVGTVDPVERVAEIRTFDHVANAYHARFGRLDITLDEYAGFMKKLDVVLNLARLRRVLVFAPADLLSRQVSDRPSASGQRWTTFALALLVLAGLAVLAGRLI